MQRKTALDVVRDHPNSIDADELQVRFTQGALDAVDLNYEDLRDEIGEFTSSLDHENLRVILTTDDGEQYEAYMSDSHADARVVVAELD